MPQAAELNETNAGTVRHNVAISVKLVGFTLENITEGRIFITIFATWEYIKPLPAKAEATQRLTERQLFQTSIVFRQRFIYRGPSGNLRPKMKQKVKLGTFSGSGRCRREGGGDLIPHPAPAHL